MIGNTVIACAIGVFLAAALDFLLSAEQKKQLADKLRELWNEMDELKKRLTSKRFLFRTLFLSFGVGVFFIVANAVVDFVESLIFFPLFNFVLSVVGSSYRYPSPTSDPFATSFYFWAPLFVAGFVASVTIIPAILLFIFMAFVSSAELVTRRLAEHEKGPLIGLGVVLAAIGAFLKGVAS